MSLSLAAAGIMGGSALVGSLLGAGASMSSSANAVKKQIAWERERATHAHQWEVKDLIKAGLNPILSAGGSGAVTGGISAPIPDTSGISNAITSAVDAIRAQKEIQNIDADTKLKEQNELLQKAQEQETIANAEEAKANAELAQAQLKAEKPKLAQKEKFNNSTPGKVLNYVGFGAEPVGQIVGAVTGLGGLAIGTKAVMNSAKGLKQNQAKFAEQVRHNKVMESKSWPKVVEKRRY